MILGELIKRARINKKMTISDVCVVTGVSQGYISKIELNQKQPSLSLLIELSETLEIPYDKLLIASGYLDKSKYLGLIQENEQLREALEFYANKSNYLIEWSDKCDEYMPSVADNDGGEIARQALSVT